MHSAQEIREQTQSELARRVRLGVPTCAGGVLYLLSAIIISNTLKGAPSVGLFEGLAPALSGVANPTVSPRTPEIKFISHHAFALLAGSVMAALAVGALTLALVLLADATLFRRPQTWRFARPLVLWGGVSLAVVSIIHQLVSAIETHSFAVGHDFSSTAADRALTTSTANEIVAYIDLFVGLAIAAGMIGLMINVLRVGLLARWMAMLGMLTGLLLFFPIGGAEFQLIPAFWMVMLGVLFIGRWPSGDPPAWAAGEARPWPSPADQRAAKASGAVAGVGDLTPAPVPVPQQGTSRKRRKRA